MLIQFSLSMENNYDFVVINMPLLKQGYEH